MTQLHAQPYDLSATGFYFESVEEFDAKANANRNDYGEPVEEYEIQFIDGDDIDCHLAKAIGISQANIAQYFQAVGGWDEDDKRRVIIAVGECGYPFEANTTPQDFDIDIYEVWNFEELADQFVEEGLFGSTGDLPRHYIDIEAIARDLRVDYAETGIAGRPLIYRCV